MQDNRCKEGDNAVGNRHVDLLIFVYLMFVLTVEPCRTHILKGREVKWLKVFSSLTCSFFSVIVVNSVIKKSNDLESYSIFLLHKNKTTKRVIVVSYYLEKVLNRKTYILNAYIRYSLFDLRARWWQNLDELWPG